MGAPIFEASTRTPGVELSAPLLAGVLARRKLAIILLAAVAATTAMIVTAVQPATFSVVVSFTPQRTRGAVPSSLGGVLGLSALAGDRSQSPAFYVELLHTQAILRKVVGERYSLGTDSGKGSGTLPAVWGQRDPSSARAIEKSIENLDQSIRAGYSMQTGVVSVTVTTGSATLSAQLAAQLLASVDAFNREAQRGEAAQQRAFTGQRLAEFRNELSVAESRLQDFLQRNRDFATSSQAAFDRERLAREVALRQQMYITLTQAFEQARMEEMRSAPQITVIQMAEVPLRANSKDIVWKGLIGALLGALVGVAALLIREVLRHAGSTQARWHSEWAEGRHRRKDSPGRR